MRQASSYLLQRVIFTSLRPIMRWAHEVGQALACLSRLGDPRHAKSSTAPRACRARPQYPACDRAPTDPEERRPSAPGTSACPRCRGTSFRLPFGSSAAPGNPARRRPRSKCAARRRGSPSRASRSEEHTSELQSQFHLVCRLLLEKKKKNHNTVSIIKKTTNKKNN